MTNTALILGASGSFGTNCTAAFTSAGWNVRKFRRGTDDMNTSAQGADVIVNGLNPQNYKNWPTELPKIANAVINAAKSSGATIIQPGNVYNFGDHPGVWNEKTPHNAQTRKGKTRTAMEATLHHAAQDHGIQIIILRAGDFIDAHPSDNFIDFLTKDLHKGRFIYPGNPDIAHAWAYLPDMARAAVMLSEQRNTLEKFEDIPFEGHTLSALEIKTALEHAGGQTLTFKGFPWAMMRLLTPVWGLAREMHEMRYLWNTPHSLDSAKLTELLPNFKATAFSDIIAQLLPSSAHVHR
ncbi:MAG: NAD-dependent epimerase/dehydratase family protein [Paracoccaceae bacterium]